MAMDHNPSGRRPQYHRGRRGMERRGSERRSQQPPEQSARPSGEADVEQIMREIRSRIAQRSGIELSTQQIQDLATRRLEAILDPRTINPTLLDQLRKGAAAAPDPLPRSAETEFSLSDDAIYEGGAVVRFFRRLFNPLMKLLFNPAPLIAALQTQTRINRDAATRAADLERRQTEWNALHYQILQRLVTEVSRTSIETQALGTRIESLTGRIDFNDKRVRTLENTPAVARAPRPQEAAPVTAPVTEPAASAESATAASPAATGDVPRRRRRRRRGRRGAPPAGESATAAVASVVTGAAGLADVDEDDDEEDAADAPEPVEATTNEQRSPLPAPSESVEPPPPAWSSDPHPEVHPTPEAPAPQQEMEQPASPPSSQDPSASEN